MTTITPPPPAPPGPPPSPAGPPPSMSPGARTGVRIAVVAAAALLLAGVVTTLGVTAWGVSTVRVTTDSQNLPIAMRSLTIDTTDVPMAVRIKTDRKVSEPRADLRLAQTSYAGEHRMVVDNDGDSTRIGIESGDTTFMTFMPWGRVGELTVTLPPEVARRLSVNTKQEAGVLLAQADLDELVARTANGGIVLSGSARRIDAHSQSDEVVTHDPIVVTEEFSATTSEGDIAVDLKDVAPAVVEATSRQGDVVVALPALGPYLLTAQSGGSTTVRVPETNDAAEAAAEVTVRSDDGDVVVRPLR